jgi:hypothetical protein
MKKKKIQQHIILEGRVFWRSVFPSVGNLFGREGTSVQSTIAADYISM